ncbi:MAG TPA: hypothetical protein VGM86_32085 [Thermoanaerobaculia bacterium]
MSRVRRRPVAAPPRYDPPSVAWWGASPLAPHLLDLFQLKSIEATVDFAPEPVIDEDRKRLAERLREAVRELKGE